MDTLSDVFAAAAVTGSVAATVSAGGRWGLQLDEIPGAAFHAVTAGTVIMQVGDRDSLTLFPGDLVLLPGGAAHTIGADDRSPVLPWTHVMSEAGAHDGGSVTIGDPPATTRILCASYQQDPAATMATFALLPEVVHVPAVAGTPALRTTLSLLADELAAPGPGAPAVLDHVVNVLLIQVMRWYLEHSALEARPPSWLRGLTDPLTTAALNELHNDPARGWTVESLARRVGVSKATLTRRFTAAVGTSPNDYLTTWRMELAARRLRLVDDPVATIARGVGYTSEYAFNRAFARRHGLPPGRYRSAARKDGSAGLSS